MTEPRTGKRYLTMAEAAEYYGMGARTLRRYIAEGKLPAYRVGNRTIRIRVADVEALARPVTRTDPDLSA